jgi:hypothetical protein
MRLHIIPVVCHGNTNLLIYELPILTVFPLVQYHVVL